LLRRRRRLIHGSLTTLFGRATVQPVARFSPQINWVSDEHAFTLGPTYCTSVEGKNI
jgi:hypothetical protein